MLLPCERPLPEVLVRADRPTGECVLRRRAAPEGPVYELVLNGKLLMDTAEHRSEEALAELGLAACAAPEGGRGLDVLVGGLGFGFTLAAVLRDARVRRAEVVELEPLLPAFLARPDVRAALGAPDLEGPRVALVQGDVQARLAAAPGAYDLVLLDVDNGPESLSAVGNEALYGPEGLARCRAALRPGGVLAVWSSEPAPAYLAALARAFDEAREHLVPVQRGRHRIDYRVLVGRTSSLRTPGSASTRSAP